MSNALTPDQLEQYRTQGYLILRAPDHNLFPDPALLQKWSDEVRAWPLDKGKWMPYFEVNDEGERQIMRTEKFVDYHDGFKATLFGEGLRSLLAQCSGDVSLVACGVCLAGGRVL